MSSFKKANRQITETTLQNLPEEVYEALGEHGYKGKIKSDKLFYAGIIYNRETVSCLVIVFLIILTMVMNQVLKFRIGFALGPLVIGFIVMGMMKAFRNKYYLFIAKDLMYFVVKKTHEILTLSVSQVTTIKSSGVNGTIHITYQQDQTPGQNAIKGTDNTYYIKFKGIGGDSGDWRNIEYALLQTDFSTKLVNEANLKRKYLGKATYE